MLGALIQTLIDADDIQPVQGVYFSEPMILKDAGTCIDMIHAARTHFGIERKPTVLLTDRRLGIVSKAMAGYARDNTTNLFKRRSGSFVPRRICGTGCAL